jgi:uncharacterized membrane protein
MGAHVPSSASQSAAQARRLRFGLPVQHGDVCAVEWEFRRNCSISPRQLLAAYAGLCAASLAVALFFWTQGARLVMVFAWIELTAVGVAMLVWARHACDRERIVLQADSLRVERCEGSRVESVEFEPEWVRVERQPSGGALIELSAQGRAVKVGRHLRPELRALLAEELRAVLRLGSGRFGTAPGFQQR